jgi:hypothetical protein
MLSHSRIWTSRAEDWGQYLQLTRHFFGRFFNTELTPPHGEMRLTMVHILAVLAVPGMMIPFYLYSQYEVLAAFNPRQLEPAVLVGTCFFVCVSLVATGFVTVLEWDALFPDLRDYTNLAPLPLRTLIIFLAKGTAVFLFIFLFSVDINAFSTFLFPVAAVSGRQVTIFYIARSIEVHGLSVFAAAGFVFLFFVALQGVLINLLSYNLFKQASLYVRALSMVLLLSLFFLIPQLSAALPTMKRTNSLVLYLLPPMWYLGLYRTLLGENDLVYQSLARISLWAFAIVAAISLVTYAACYMRHVQQSLEAAGSVAREPLRRHSLLAWMADRFIVRNQPERAAFYFIAKTLARSAKHRLFFATFVGVGCAFVAEGLVALFSSDGLWRLSRPDAILLSVPLVLSFFMLAGLRGIFTIPAELPANWIFQLTEGGDGRACLAAARKAMIALAVLPLFLLLFPLYGVLWGWPTALLNLIFGLVLSLALTETLLLRFQKMPFTCSYLPGKGNLGVRAMANWFAFTTYAYTMARLEVLLLANPLAMLVFYAVVLAAWGGLIAHRNKMLRLGAELIFQEEPEPVVQTLELAD